MELMHVIMLCDDEEIADQQTKLISYRVGSANSIITIIITAQVRSGVHPSN